LATLATTVEQYSSELARFNASMKLRGVADIENYYWYHTVGLPDGLVTPGMYDYRPTVGAFQFPENMRGMTALDVGTATGYFAFEFERRGAQVTSVDLPSLELLDRFPGQETSTLLKKIQHMIVPHSADKLSGLIHEYSGQELHHYLLDGPFRLCAQALGSKVERRYATIYDLSPERLGRSGYDFVFLGDILVHTLRPFDAIVAAARMCLGTLVIAQMMPGAPEDPAAMVYAGGEKPGEDDICWWLPNEQCFLQILKKLGFADVRVVGIHEGEQRPAGHPFSRKILHARRAMAK
jgi:tRNA (mo5U34)-methyltransferase